MKKSRKFSVLILLILILSFAGSGIVSAEESAENVETAKKYGSIEIELTDGGVGTSKEGVVFSYSYVADLVHGEYRLLDRYKESRVDFEQIKHAKDMEEAAKKLAKYADDEKQVITDKNGKAEIRELPIGVYLIIVADKADYDEITPFLVAIPTFSDTEKEMKYDLRILPKHTPNPPGKIVTETPPTVKTGDSAKSALYLGLAGTAGFLAVAVIAMLRYQHKKRKAELEREIKE
ncbi:hypothetical protein ABXS75_10830 [Roseburia hominis]